MSTYQIKAGSAGWETIWENLEHAGNIGIQYCINPVLYPAVANTLLHKTRAVVVDFGAGTNSLGYELLFAKAKQVPALQNIPHATALRNHVEVFIGLEQSKALINEAKLYPPKLMIKKWNLSSSPPPKNKSIDLAVSRNFFMHLSIPMLKKHLADVASALKPKGEYIFSVLNPDYEIKRNKKWGGAPLRNGKHYKFAQGSMPNALFMHYFKTTKTLEKSFSENFTIAAKLACYPVTTQFKHTHERYYSQKCPMAYVYKLVKHA